MKQKILLQIDHDAQPSSFDSIVALDSDIDRLLTYRGVTPIQIESIIHGAMFTRGRKELHNTAVFFGGSDVERTTELFEQAKICFFGPLRVSMMTDPNGSNTTAAAAVLCAARHISFNGETVTVLAGTGPVGRRICQLAGSLGAHVRLCSRNLAKARSVCELIAHDVGNMPVVPLEVVTPNDAEDAIRDSNAVFAAGAAGVELLGDQWLARHDAPNVAIDVNAVPPFGIRGVAATDEGTQRHATVCYGALGVGGLKMKIHRQAIRRLFETNDSILDLNEIYQIGQELPL